MYVQALVARYELYDLTRRLPTNEERMKSLAGAGIYSVCLCGWEGAGGGGALVRSDFKPP